MRTRDLGEYVVRLSEGDDPIATRKRDLRLERLAEDGDRPRLVSDVRYNPTHPRFGRWVWVVVDVAAGELLYLGCAWTRQAATRRKHRAFLKALNEMHDGRAES